MANQVLQQVLGELRLMSGDYRCAFLTSYAKNNGVRGVRELIENGVDVDERYHNGRTALSLSATGGDMDVVRVLIEVGATIDDGSGKRIRALQI